MAIVIGLDFGNFNSYPSYIEDLDADHRRLGGKSADLLPSSEIEGVPSVFFFDGRGGFLAGRAAVTGAARPERNRIRYLKRSLGKPLTIRNNDGTAGAVEIGGKAWLYDDAVREVVQSVLYEANRTLLERTRETTDLVSLAYPATYSPSQRERLIQIVNSATLENSDRHFQVVGTIAEPAAAALDYLVQMDCGKETTVLVFDLGGGTFDLSLVTCYPEGKEIDGGDVAYYDVHCTDGLPDVGGREFDEVIYGLLREKLEGVLRQAGHRMTNHLEEVLRQNSEMWKKELSREPYRTLCVLYVPVLDEDVELELTREEFESAPRAQEMLRQMTDKAAGLLRTPGAPQPERIVLTGGACRMPMVREALVRALPEYAQIIDGTPYRPEKAISYGAARYGIPEQTVRGPVVKRTAYDLGVRYYHDKEDETGFIKCLIPRGTILPHTSDWSRGRKLNAGEKSDKMVYEATTLTPDSEQPDRDYRLIKTISVDFGEVVPEGTASEIRLKTDNNGLVTMEARQDENSPVFTGFAQLLKLD